jgi:hypothetical protein
MRSVTHYYERKDEPLALRGLGAVAVNEREVQLESALKKVYFFANPRVVLGTAKITKARGSTFVSVVWHGRNQDVITAAVENHVQAWNRARGQKSE